MSRPTRTIQPKKGINKRKLMNSMVNIPSTNPDPHYRYKMPALEIRINPARIRTNNLKREPVEVPASTQIQNLAPIAKALNRPVEYLSKYFELELEMQGVMEDRQRWFKLCGGELTEHELMMVLDKFIRRFVLCYICNNPETALTIFNSYIVKECGACGQSTRVDRFSKLTRYLLRNRNFGIGFAPVSVDATRCRFLKEGVTTTAKGTVMNGASGFKNGVKVATDAEIEDNEEDDDEDDETTQADWKLDISAEAVAERRQRELDLITRVEKIMNAGIGDKARDPYKVFEEFVTSPKDIGPTATDQSLPDLEEVLGKFYTLDLEKGGAIFVLESLQKRQQEIARDAKENIQEETSETKVVRRDDYDAIIKVLKDSLEREVIVTGSLEEISDESSSSDSDDDDDDEDDNEE